MIFKALKEMNTSVLGFGCWAVGGTWNDTEDQTSIRTMQTAVELGINFFDVAPVYGLGHAETLLGKALETTAREQVYIASKCGLVWNNPEKAVKNNLTKASIIEEVDQSLVRLQTDYIDLLQCHWPDPNTPLEETAEGLRAVVESGKVRHLGVSNFSLEMTQELMQHCELATYQGLYNLLEPNATHYHNIPLSYRSRDEIIPLCEKHDLKYLPYSPLMQGLLTGTFKPSGNFDEKDDRANNPKLNSPLLEQYLGCADELKAYADTAGMPLAHLAMGWLMAQDAVGPIITGAYQEWQVKENIAVTERTYDAALLKGAEDIVAKWSLA
ncbi:aldo/keto reductase [Pseudovibrio brasiliensis]|uniref:Aldo/keto reductase n=1 Tax=Pseudovibrio brasiliensis TaxID=1898042 RepID=A0ABX8ANR3_9HYPH|nr:aldo/keto reductase [Pseudovibrio brasiliensis]QUS56719.1 aldo/keto reductase [Pseudovibrio brasiliensis]